MYLSSTEQLKSNGSPQEMPRRTAHGGMAWASAVPPEVKLYQPQDGSAEPRSRVADIASRLRKMAGEPEDARITGGTRSLMRRLSGLNVGINMVRRALPVPAKSVPVMKLSNVNVA